jgi:hypothetical protein
MVNIYPPREREEEEEEARNNILMRDLFENFS